MKRINENIERFNPSPDAGLDNNQVQYMKDHGCVNKTKNPTNKSYFAIVFGNIFTFFNILMFSIAVVLVLIVGQKVFTNLMFLLIIVCNILIGTVQECKSKHTIEKLKLLSNDKITVRRNGELVGVYAHEIVLDDVLILSPGDQIPADCVILEENEVEVNESLLTGESVPVKKTKDGILYAGSFIVSGMIAARADKVGNDTYIFSIEKKARSAKQPKSRLMIAINSVIRTLAFIAIPLAFIVFINEFLQSIADDPNLNIWPTFWGEETVATNAVFYCGTTITFMIPAGMALLASVAMATGVVKLAQSKTLAQDLYSVESLSRVNTLCLDKTGTLTDGTMMVEDLKIIDKNFTEEKVSSLISSYLSAFKATNQTSKALIDRFGENNELKVIDTVEFSSARKFSAVEFEKDGWFVLGAPEFLTEDKKVLNQVSEYAKNGLRVILLAKVVGEYLDKELPPKQKSNIAMFIIRDNIRPEVRDTMIWFRENDVDIKVISGDNIGTVSYIAKQCGIENYDKVFDMSTLKDTDDFEAIVMNNTIFGRVTPDQKADIIAVLKKNKRVVGVTGDGLNDLLAFKQADCSIALANGAAATKNVANLILLDSNFANMKEAVFQGRRVVNNIQRSSSLFVMKDFLWFLITVLPIVIGIRHMVQPTVMTIVNLFITGLASLFISLEPDKTRVKGNFYKNVVGKAVVSAIFMFIPVLLITAYFLISSIIRTQTYDVQLMETVFTAKEGSTIGEITQFGWLPVMALCISISGFLLFFESCRPFTKYRAILYAATVGIVLFFLYFSPEYFVVSGTEMLKQTGGVQNMPYYIATHLWKNAMLSFYRTMSVEQFVFLLLYAAGAYPIYLLLNKPITKLVNLLLFSKRDFDEE